MGKAVTITLDDKIAAQAEARLTAGEYDSMSEMLSEGLRALDREEAAFNAMLKVKVQEALDDPRPHIPLAEAFAEVRAAAKARRER